MDCLTAEPFISILYDGEKVPEEAERHIAGCASCQASLRAYAALSSEIRALAVSATQALPPLAPPPVRLPSLTHCWRAVRKPVRVPRIAAAACAVLLIAAAAGLLRTIAQTRTVTRFRLEMQTWHRLANGSVSAGSGTALMELHKPDLGCESERDGANTRAWARLTEVLSMRSDAVVLSVRLKSFRDCPDPDQLIREMKKVKPQEITYVPGQQVRLPIEGGDSVLLSGSVVKEEEGRMISVKQESLLPAVDQMSLGMPILVRDGKEIAAKQPSAGADIRCPDDKQDTCGIFLYSPGAGLFFFSIHPIAGSIPGTAAMSAALFSEDGHSYTLYSSTPITGGDQPRNIWILHLRDYLPSQHGGFKSADALDSLGSGDHLSAAFFHSSSAEP